MRKKILVKGYFKENLGDDLFFKILSNRYPRAQFEAIVEPKDRLYYRQISGIKFIPRNIPFRILNRLIRIFNANGIYALLVHRYEAVVEIGGSIFPQVSENQLVNSQRTYLQSKIPHYFVIGSNFGPFQTQSFLDSYRQFFGKIDGSVFRERQTVELFSSLSNVRYAPDVVFNLNIPNKSISYEKPYVAISVIDLKLKDPSRDQALNQVNKEYINAIYQMMKCFADKGYAIKFVPFSNLQHDNLVSEQLATRLRSENNDVSVEVVTLNGIDEKIQVIQNSSYLISSRYHAMILGWQFQIPQIVLAYSGKTINVIHDLFPEQYFIDVRQLSRKSFSFDLGKMNTYQSVQDTREDAQQQFYYLDTFMANR